jgi:hypothetical protein
MTANGSRLSALTKDLWERWQQTRESWADAKSLEFEHQYLQELIASVDKSVAVMEELDKLLVKIRQDCE